jgi:prepilin-type processing-associated H-X9-DG protein
LRWTKELHEYKGNVLFADAHVEEWTKDQLAASPNNSGAVADFFLPTATRQNPAQPAYGNVSPSYGGNSGYTPRPANPGASAQPASPMNQPSFSANSSYNSQPAPRISASPVESPALIQNSPGALISSNFVKKIPAVTNLPVEMPTQAVVEAAPTFDERVVKTVRPVLEWGYLLLLLLALLFLALEIRRRVLRNKKRKAGLKR